MRLVGRRRVGGGWEREEEDGDSGVAGGCGVRSAAGHVGLAGAADLAWPVPGYPRGSV